MAKKYPFNPILIVDDEEAILDGQRNILATSGITNVICETDGRNIKKIFNNYEIELVLLDLVMPHRSGSSILTYIHDNFPDVPVIIITGTDDVNIAVDCMKNGAVDYMVKAIEKIRLVSGVKRAIAFRQLRRENSLLKASLLKSDLKIPSAFKGIITEDNHLMHLFLYAELIAGTNEPILLTGETGSGKDLFVQAIHKSKNRNCPYIAINVAGIDDHSFSDTLFGHQKGAFTGAQEHRPGFIQKADGGVLFLDEIGDLSMESQIKLLRLIDTGEYYPLGSDKAKKARVKIVTATNCNLEELVKEGKFRKDLYFRLETHAISLPPLRNRTNDLPLLISHFLPEIDPCSIDEIVSLLCQYEFPGNVRELRSLLLDAQQRTLLGKTLSEAIGEKLVLKKIHTCNKKDDAYSFSSVEHLPDIKTATALLVSEALKRAKGNQTTAARILGISKQALNQRLTKDIESIDN